MHKKSFHLQHTLDPALSAPMIEVLHVLDSTSPMHCSMSLMYISFEPSLSNK